MDINIITKKKAIMKRIILALSLATAFLFTGASTAGAQLRKNVKVINFYDHDRVFDCGIHYHGGAGGTIRTYGGDSGLTYISMYMPNVSYDNNGMPVAAQWRIKYDDPNSGSWNFDTTDGDRAYGTFDVFGDGNSFESLYYTQAGSWGGVGQYKAQMDGDPYIIDYSDDDLICW